MVELVWEVLGMNKDWKRNMVVEMIGNRCIVLWSCLGVENELIELNFVLKIIEILFVSEG